MASVEKIATDRGLRANYTLRTLNSLLESHPFIYSGGEWNEALVDKLWPRGPKGRPNRLASIDANQRRKLENAARSGADFNTINRMQLRFGLGWKRRRVYLFMASYK